MRTKPANDCWRSLGSDPLRATALIAAIGNGGAFHKGREFAAWMGVVSSRTLHRWPAEAARYQQTWELLLARLFVQGARAVLQTAHEAVFRSECVVGTAHIPHAPQRRRRSVS